jgi:hypothetical protein
MFIAISAIYVLNTKTQGLVMSTMYVIFPVGASLVGLYAAKMYGFNKTSARVLLPIVYGLTCWALGEIIWYVLKNLLHMNPFPSLGDISFLLGYPFVSVGIYHFYIMSGAKLERVKKSLLIPAVLISIILTILVVYFGMYQAYNPNTSLMANTVKMGYGMDDIILIVSSLFAVLAAHEYINGKLALLWETIIPGFIIYLIADVLFALYSTQYINDIKPYTYIDLLWIASYLILAFGILENVIDIYTVQKKIKLQLQQRK